ncbi:MAG: MopE-related protein [Chitinophagaceae bacterium]
MKKKFILSIAFSITIMCQAQQVIHLANGAVFSIKNNTEVSLLGGITLEEGSSVTNNGILRLKNNPVANISNWIDNSSSGALSGTGMVIFNSSSSHSFTGLSNFYSLQINAGGLLLNNNLSISNQLHLINGKVTTSGNHIFLNNNNSYSFLNDGGNTGYTNSWINGNFRRLITTNTSTYDFPVGNDTKCNLLQFVNYNIAGTVQLTASFVPKPGTDAGLNVSESGSQYVAVNNAGVWNLVPDIIPSAGNYSLQLYLNGFTGLADNQFGMLRRPDASNNAADWSVPAGSSLEALNGAGRKVSDGYARRINISEFSQWGIGHFQTLLFTWYQDADGDSYGNAEVTQQSSNQPAGYVSDATDCDDGNAAVHPGAAEICNGIDDDCNGLADDADPGITGQTIWYADTDNDGYGNPAVTTLSCNQPEGYVSNNDDCDDTDNAITVQILWYADIDNDGYGNPLVTTLSCNQPEDYVSNNNDCDDTNDVITVGSIWYADADNDSYGNPTVKTLSCNQPEGYVSNNNDCDDTNNVITVGSIWYADADNDGYGNIALTILACSQPLGYVANADDCNDAKGKIHPGATEVCNGVDDDCDGQTDEGCTTINISDAEVYESEGLVNINVTLSMAINQPVKIHYKTIDRTAVSSGRNKDYKGVGNSSLTIPAGQTSGIISIEIFSDNLNESDEYFDVELTKVVNALPGDNSGRVTIHNGTPTFLTRIEKGKTKLTVVEGLEVNIFPNPTTNNFSIIVQADASEKITMQVIDMYGRIIETRNVTANSIIQFGERYVSGTYFVRVQQGKEHKEIKLIKLVN